MQRGGMAGGGGDPFGGFGFGGGFTVSRCRDPIQNCIWDRPLWVALTRS